MEVGVSLGPCPEVRRVVGARRPTQPSETGESGARGSGQAASWAAAEAEAEAWQTPVGPETCTTSTPSGSP